MVSNKTREVISKSAYVAKRGAKLAAEGGDRILKARPLKAIRSRYDRFQDAQDERRAKKLERLERRADLVEKRVAIQERIERARARVRKGKPGGVRRFVKGAGKTITKAKTSKSLGSKLNIRGFKL